MTNSEKAFENWLFAQPFFDAESYAIDSSVYATEKEAWNAAIEFAANVCMEQPIGLVGTVQKIFAHQIRKQGAE